MTFVTLNRDSFVIAAANSGPIRLLKVVKDVIYIVDTYLTADYCECIAVKDDKLLLAGVNAESTHATVTILKILF